MANISRMQFLTGDIKGKNTPFRPPWALPENDFVDFCSRCDKCIDACFDELIVKGRGGYPQMDFKRGGCDFCEDCLNACASNALVKIPVSTPQIINNQPDNTYLKPDSPSYLPPWQIKASIDMHRCLSMNATICRSCGEACDDEAIKFKLQLGGIAEPVLDNDRCAGCGSCFAVCPVQVIELKVATLTQHEINQGKKLASSR